MTRAALIQDLRAEADLCLNEGVEELATLLYRAADEIARAEPVAAELIADARLWREHVAREGKE